MRKNSLMLFFMFFCSHANDLSRDLALLTINLEYLLGRLRETKDTLGDKILADHPEIGVALSKAAGYIFDPIRYASQFPTYTLENSLKISGLDTLYADETLRPGIKKGLEDLIADELERVKNDMKGYVDARGAIKKSDSWKFKQSQRMFELYISELVKLLQKLFGNTYDPSIDNEYQALDAWIKEVQKKTQQADIENSVKQLQDFIASLKDPALTERFMIRYPDKLAGSKDDPAYTPYLKEIEQIITTFWNKAQTEPDALQKYSLQLLITITLHETPIFLNEPETSTWDKRYEDLCVAIYLGRDDKLPQILNKIKSYLPAASAEELKFYTRTLDNMQTSYTNGAIIHADRTGIPLDPTQGLPKYKGIEDLLKYLTTLQEKK